MRTDKRAEHLRELISREQLEATVEQNLAVLAEERYPHIMLMLENPDFEILFDKVKQSIEAFIEKLSPEERMLRGLTEYSWNTVRKAPEETALNIEDFPGNESKYFEEMERRKLKYGFYGRPSVGKIQLELIGKYPHLPADVAWSFVIEVDWKNGNYKLLPTHTPLAAHNPPVSTLDEIASILNEPFPIEGAKIKPWGTQISQWEDTFAPDIYGQEQKYTEAYAIFQSLYFEEKTPHFKDEMLHHSRDFYHFTYYQIADDIKEIIEYIHNSMQSLILLRKLADNENDSLPSFTPATATALLLGLNNGSETVNYVREKIAQLKNKVAVYDNQIR